MIYRAPVGSTCFAVRGLQIQLNPPQFLPHSVYSCRRPAHVTHGREAAIARAGRAAQACARGAQSDFRRQQQAYQQFFAQTVVRSAAAVRVGAASGRAAVRMGAAAATAKRCGGGERHRRCSACRCPGSCPIAGVGADRALCRARCPIAGVGADRALCRARSQFL